MKIYQHLFLVLMVIANTGILPLQAIAWHDETHLAVAKAAGYSRWYNATGADQVKLKADDERLNHYCNLPEGTVVDAAFVLNQKKRYNQSSDRQGHLYGAILGALEDYRNVKVAGKYAEYHLAFAAHYIGDLSQPLHNVPYDRFNQANHQASDGIVEDEVLKNLAQIKTHMRPIDLGEDPWRVGLPSEIARLADISRILGETLRKEDRMLTRDEAYRQLGHSAALLQAILKALQDHPQETREPI